MIYEVGLRQGLHDVVLLLLVFDVSSRFETVVT